MRKISSVRKYNRNKITRKFKYEGFTIMELLATVTILGIISVFAIASVSNLISKSGEKYYDSQKEQMVLASQTYMQNNRNNLPKAIGQKRKVTLDELYNKKYIKDKVIDQTKKECDSTKSYVSVFKYSKNEYSYTAFLDCPAREASKEDEIEPYAKIKFIEDEIEIEGSSSKIKTAKAKVKLKGNLSDSNIALMSYSYRIYVDGSQKYDSGSLTAGYAKEKDVEIPLGKYLPGKVKIYVTVVNITGGTKTFTSKEMDYIDFESPTCGKVTGEAKHTGDKCDEWINASSTENPTRKVTVECNDNAGIGCGRESYTQTFGNDAKTENIIIEDRSTPKNQFGCRVFICVDKSYPSMTVNIYKRNSDGTKDKKIATNNVGPGKLNSSITLDWLNNTNYPNGVVIEAVTSDPIGLGKTIWNWNDKELKQTDPNVNILPNTNKSEKELVGETDSTVTHDFYAEGYRKGTLTLEDEAGNKVSMDITVPMDRTAPTKPVLTNPTNGNWTKDPFSITGTSSDKLSGLHHWRYKYAATGWTDYADSAKSPFTTTPFSLERNEDVYISVCDVAGNCSDNSTSPIKIDRTNPTCSFDGQNTTWKNSVVTITPKCSDATSGCSTSNILTPIKYSTGTHKTETLSVNISDKAGNSTTCSQNVNIYFDLDPPSNPSGGSIGNVSGSNTNGNISTKPGASTDTGSGFDKHYYCIKNAATKPSKNDACFTSSTSFSRSCGTSYYGWAVAVDKVGNRTEPVSLGSTSDGTNTYSTWGSCQGACGEGTQYRTNSCDLVTTGLSRSCSTGIGCCDRVVYKDGSSCNKLCGGGTYNQLAYSAYDGTRCPSSDKTSGGSACNTGSCCSQTEKAGSNCTSWSNTTCTKTCGGGFWEQERTCNYRSSIDHSTICSTTYKETRTSSSSCNTAKCEKPKCTLTLSGTKGTNGWYVSNVDVTMKVTGTVTKKGLSTSKNSTNGRTTDTRNGEGSSITYYGYVENSVGSNTCSVTFKIDKTRPTITYQNETYRQCGTPVTHDYRATIHITDAMSGYGRMVASIKNNTGGTVNYDLNRNCAANEECREGFCQNNRPTGTYTNVKLYDKAGNCTMVPAGASFTSSGSGRAC